MEDIIEKHKQQRLICVCRKLLTQQFQSKTYKTVLSSSPPCSKHADLIADLGHLLHDILLILQATLLRLRARLWLAIVLPMGDCQPGDGRDQDDGDDDHELTLLDVTPVSGNFWS